MTVNYKKSFCDMRRIEPFPLCHHSLLDGLHLLGSSQFMPWSLLIVLEDQSMNHHESFIQSGDFYLRTVHGWGLSANAQAEICGKPEKNCAWVKHFFTSFLPLLCGCFKLLSTKTPRIWDCFVSNYTHLFLEIARTIRYIASHDYGSL